MARKHGKDGPVAVPPPDAAPAAPPEELLPPADGYKAKGPGKAYGKGQEPEQQSGTQVWGFEERPVKEGRGHHKEPSAGIFARISELTKEDWERHVIYVYRLAPIIDQSAAGRATYITKYQERIDEDRILHDFGSGGYRVCLNRVNDSGGSSNIFRAEFNMLHLDFPPRVVPGTWVDDPRNAKWVWGKLKHSGQPESATDSTSSDKTDPLRLLEAVDTMIERRLSKNTEPSVLQTATALMNLAKANAPAAPPTDRSVDVLRDELKDLRVQLAEERAENRRLQQSMFEDLKTKATAPAPAPPQSRAEILQEMVAEKEAIEKLAPRRGGDSPAQESEPAWLQIVRPLAEQLAPVAGAFIQNAISQPPQPRQQQPQAHPMPAGQPQPEQRIIPGGTVQLKTAVPEVIAKNFMEAMTWMDEGKSGGDYAEWLDADPSHRHVIRQLRQIGADQVPPVQPVDAILAIAKSIPLAWRMIESVPGKEEQLRQFLTEIIVWTPEQEQPTEATEGN